MDPGVTPWHSTPRGRPPAGMVPWRGGYLHRPVPLPRPSSSPYYQMPDHRSGPQPWPDAWVESHHQRQPVPTSSPESRAEFYERGVYPYRPQSRQSYDEMYRAYPVPVPREDYGGYYHAYSRAAPEERDWRQEDFSGRQSHYWDPGYYGAHRAEQENGPFPARDAAQYRTNNYDENDLRTSVQERNGEDFQGDSREESSDWKHGLSSSAEPSLLQRYKESGLSSSSYELSQYMFDSSDPCNPVASEVWSPVAAEEDLSSTLQSVTPLKYSLPHVVVCFGAGGQMVRVCPNYPTEGQPAVIEIHSLEVILHDTQEQEEMRAFLGPLFREDLHKVDVISFCQRKAALIQRSNTPRSRDAALLWQLLVLLCRQNGSMVGSDIADLLMQDCKREKYMKQETNSNLINLSDDTWAAPGIDTPDLLTGEVPSCTETAKQAVEKFTKLLFYGRKKEALDWAMRSQLWGHALFLSSKMDLRTYSWVMGRFTSSLTHNDPLQTLFQLMSGRIPQASTCCGDPRWGDWRPHLAVILSNQAGDAELTQRAILTMGDTLAMKGLIEASHCCYLMANITFGFYSVKKDPLVLLGSSHSQTFKAFATTEAIQQTEILEYCRRLGQPGTFIPSFQVYKLVYASRLADYGLASQALHYCEGIGSALLAQTSGSVLVAEAIKLAERLKFSDPCLQEGPDHGQNMEPDWLTQLRVHWRQLQVEINSNNRTPENPETAVEGGVLEGHLAHTGPSHGHQDLQSAALTQRDGHSRTPEYYTHRTEEEMGLCQQGIPQHLIAFQPGASTMLDGPGPTEAPVQGYSWGDAHPLGYSAVPGQPKNLPQDSSALVYQPPGDAALTEGPQRSHPRFEHETDAPAQQGMRLSRIRTVSECSTISVDEDAAPPQDGGARETEEQLKRALAGDREQEEQTKASGSGWFRWFRSKSAKEVAAPAPKPVPTGAPTMVSDPAPAAMQGMMEPLPLAPSAGFPPSSVPPPPAALLSPSGRNPFCRSASNKDQSRTKDDRSPLASPGERAAVPAFSPGGHPPPATGSVHLYNPSQMPSAMGSAHNPPRTLSQRRYPTQP